MNRLGVAIGLLLATQCAVGSAQSAARTPRDTGRREESIPAGFGSLRRDDIALNLQVQGLSAKVIPLDENVIRALAPDVYNSLRAIRESRAAEIERVRMRTGLTSVQVWQVSFFNQQPGEARYDPRGMQIRSAGRDFRPLDVIGVSAGYAEGRLAQSRNSTAIFVFDPAIQLSQPLIVTIAGVQNEAWTDDILQLLDRERAAIWSRSAATRKQPIKPGTSPW